MDGVLRLIAALAASGVPEAAVAVAVAVAVALAAPAVAAGEAAAAAVAVVAALRVCSTNCSDTMP